MTRKDFVVIANALKTAKPSKDVEYVAMETWRQSVLALHEALRHTNRNFDSKRFLDACGFEGGL